MRWQGREECGEGHGTGDGQWREWVIYPMENLWKTIGKPMEHYGKPQTVGKPMENPWKNYGTPIEHSWKTYGKPMENSWKTYGKALVGFL